MPDSGVSLGIEGVSVLDLDQKEKDFFQLQPGRVIEMVGVPGTGLTRLGLGLLAPYSKIAPVVVLDVRGVDLTRGCMGDRCSPPRI